MRDRPARCACHEAEFALLVVAVDLVDHAVDAVGQPVALAADLVEVSKAALGTARQRVLRASRESPFAQLRHGRAVTVGDHGIGIGWQVDAVGIKRQRPGCGHARVELAQRTGRAIARVGQRLAALAQHARVPGVETGLGHVHLAAHFQHRRPAFATQAQRDGLDRAQVGGHVLAGRAVTAGGTLHEDAVFVTQADRETVQLGFHREPGVADAQALLDAANEVAYLVVRIGTLGRIDVTEGVRQRQHRNGMAYFREFRSGLRSDPVRRRIRRGEIRMGGLDRLQFTHHAVVLGVRNGRVVEHVVPVIRVIDRLAQGIGLSLRRVRMPIAGCLDVGHGQGSHRWVRQV